jgi:hypothetical protein
MLVQLLIFSEFSLLLSGIFAAAATTPRRTFHVAPHEGAVDDAVAADGSAAAPMTISQAHHAVRSLLAVSPDAAAEVRLAHGDYFNVSLRLTERDSGDVIWRGPGPGEGAPATIYGGSKVSGPWTRAPAVGDHVWQVPLPPYLLDTGGRAVFRQLVQGERSAWLAREPDFGAGFLTCGGNNGGFTCGAGVLPKHFDCVNSSCSAFTRAGYSSDIRAVTGVNFTSDGGAHVSVVSAGTSASRGSWCAYCTQSSAHTIDTQHPHAPLDFMHVAHACITFTAGAGTCKARWSCWIAKESGLFVTECFIFGLTRLVESNKTRTG